jgi:hypothetical protein
VCIRIICVCAYVYLSRDSGVRVCVYMYLSREGGQVYPLSFLFWDASKMVQSERGYTSYGSHGVPNTQRQACEAYANTYRLTRIRTDPREYA